MLFYVVRGFDIRGQVFFGGMRIILIDQVSELVQVEFNISWRMKDRMRFFKNSPSYRKFCQDRISFYFTI